ncbi:MAG: insulinase family protein [Clostridia bacterium]|nr:insulinase family protein [Clostridia bacterium]
MFIIERFSRKKLADGVHFNKIYDDRFATSRLSVTFIMPIDKERCAANTAVSCLLTRTCREYPTYRELSKKLEYLYGMSLGTSGGRYGDMQTFSISSGCINDEYALGGESVCNEMAHLVCGLIFDPNVKDGAFDEESLRQEKRQLIDAIDAQYGDKRAYAKKQFLEFMCEGDPYGVNLLGTKESVDALTAEGMYEVYKDLMRTARIEITFLGKTDCSAMENIFSDRFANVERDYTEGTTKIVRRAESVREKTDLDEVYQSKLMLGFRTDCARGENSEEEVIVLDVMNSVLGGTAHSKLFNNVREKLSLCYYCVSSKDVQKGIITIESGVEKDNIEKTKQAILAEIEEMKNGNITDDEIITAKLSIVNSVLSTLDTASGTMSWYISRSLNKTTYTPEETIEMINSVTKEDIVNMAKRLTLDTVYVLTGSGKEGE